MKYIYKHGNQYWYQRAIPHQISEMIGRKSLKISLKTNKIPTAIKRAKLQALEHKKMFKNIYDLKKKTFSRIFKLKHINLDKYSLNFPDDYEESLNKLLFNKSELLKYLNQISAGKTIGQVDNIALDIGDISLTLSESLNEYLKIKKISDKKKITSIRKSITTMISICRDKPIIDYSKLDAKMFRDYYVNLNKVSTGKRNQSNIQNLFSEIFNKYQIEKSNPFSGLAWPVFFSETKRESFSINELKKIKTICLENHELQHLICGLVFDTGCSFQEVAGLENADLILSKYNPHIVIRTNSIRKVNNLYKKRIIPLVGVSLQSAKKIKRCEDKKELFGSYLTKGSKSLKTFENLINQMIKTKTNGKTMISFSISVIERLKEVGCPENIISEVMGMAKKPSFYESELNLDIKASWLKQMTI